MEIVISHPFKALTSEELIALLSAVATAILAVIIIMMLYFGREIIVLIALAILLSFVLAPLVGLLQRAVGEFSNNLSDQEDRSPKIRSTSDAEATSAVEGVAEDAGYDVPVLRNLPLNGGASILSSAWLVGL